MRRSASRKASYNATLMSSTPGGGPRGEADVEDGKMDEDEVDEDEVDKEEIEGKEEAGDGDYSYCNRFVPFVHSVPAVLQY